MFFLETSISVDVYYVILDYTFLSGNDYIVEESRIPLAHLHALVVTVLTGLEQSEKHGGHIQKSLRKHVFKTCERGGQPSYWTGS